jgi:hypothetical protein
MMNLESPNGYFCSYKSRLCREDYRFGCEKCLRGTLSEVLEKPKDWKRDMWETRDAAATGFPAKLAGLFSARQPSLSVK